MAHTHLNDWLARLEVLHPKAIDLGLNRVTRVAEILQLFPFPHFVITVAGTNGKGSCVALLEAMLLESEYRVGAYTSPHLFSYNERLRVQGEVIDEKRWCDAFQVVDEARDHTSLTYFEFGTLAALWLLTQMKLDVVILEVGLGGRLDAVNSVDADLAIITTIALDHTEWLGSDREAIGKEKAGIFRSHKPAICGDFATPDTVLEYAKQQSVPLYCQGQDFGYMTDLSAWSWWGGQCYLANLPLPLLALQNAATVLKAVELLTDQFAITRTAIEKALTHTTLPGRFQLVLIEERQCIFDVAHNPAAANYLAERLRQHHCAGKTYAVWAMLADKDMMNTAKPLQDIVSAWYVANLDVPRGASQHRLVECLQDLGVQSIYAHDVVALAYQDAIAKSQPGDRIVIFGSFYTVMKAC